MARGLAAKMRALLAIWVSDIYLFKFIMKIHSWAGDGEKEGEGALHNGPVSGDYFTALRYASQPAECV